MGFNSPSHNPENCRSNTCKKLLFEQKINWALDRSNIDPKDFLHEVQFFAAIGAAHFPAAETGLLSPLSPAIFTRIPIIAHDNLGENGFETWASIARIDISG